MANEELEVKEKLPMDETGEMEAVRPKRRLRDFIPHVVTFLLAIIIWAVAMEVNPPDAYRTFEDVSIKLLNVSDAQVEVVDGSEFTVDVTVVAKKNRISLLNEEDITLVVDTFGIEEDGTYQLEILCVLPSGYKVYRLSQETVTVKVTLEGEGS